MTDINFSSLLGILKRRQWLGISTFTSVILGAIAYLILVPPQYQVGTRLMINDRQVGVSELGQDLSQLSSYRPGEPNPIATQAQLVKSRNVLNKAINIVFPQGLDQATPPLSTKQIKKNLQVKIIPGTNILEITFKHPDPQVSAKFLNEVTQALVAENIRTIRSQATAVKEFLEEEIPKQKKRVQTTTLAENTYRKQYGLISEQEQTSNLVNSFQSLENQERSVIAALQNNRRKIQELQNLIGLEDTEKAYLAGQVAQDEALRTLQNKLVELEIALANARSKLTETHPTVLSLLEEQDKVLNLYKQELSKVTDNSELIAYQKFSTDELSQDLISQLILAQIEGLSLQEQLNTLEAQKQTLDNRLQQLPTQQQALSQLVRQREEAVNTLKFLEGKLGEARLTEAQLLSNIKIIEIAEVPDNPAFPDKKVVLVLGIFSASVLTVGMILILELMDDKLHDIDGIKQELDLPLLGVLPNLSPSECNLQLPDFFLSNLGAVETYRMLLKTLEFQDEKSLNLIVISSTIAGEGKSTIVAHLGAVSAILSRKTLIIDADFRQPTQHNIFGVSHQVGLTDILNKTITISEAIKSTSIPNLSLLTCGDLPSIPSQMIESPEMKELLSKVTESYDFVIVDTAPISSCADANILSRQGEGLVIVTRSNVTPKTMLLQGISDLKAINTSLLGIIMNGMTNNTTPYYRYPLHGYPLKEITSDSKIPHSYTSKK